MRHWAVFAAATMLMWPVVSAPAGSIYARGRARTQAIFTDDVARNIGDVLTIVIEEQSKIENASQRKMDKSDTRSAKIQNPTDLVGGLNQATGKLFNLDKLDFQASSSTEFEGSANYDSDRSMADRITVTVNDVLPNGNLVVVGERRRKAAGDTQIVEVSGIVRPSDITLGNTVSSRQVAEFNIVFRSQGQENQFTKPGWLGRILNFLNPF
jgi:flagellar L-ring protein precursor FlgH